MRTTTLAVALALALALPVLAVVARAADPASCAVPLTAPAGGEEPLVQPCELRIRPGSHMTSPAGCTMNWVFRDETGALYIGTAGHCLGATGSTGRRVSISALGPIGTSVFTQNAGIGADFGLVKIDSDKYHLVDPTLCRWGGPAAMAEGNGDYGGGQRVILQYGFGTAYGALPASRGRVFEGEAGAVSLAFRGLSAGGDSGSPLMFANGDAAGVLTHGVGIPPFNIGAGLSWGSRLDVHLARAEAATGHDFTLVTSDVPVQIGMGVPFPVDLP